MSTPLIDNLWRQLRQKWGNEKNVFPVDRKPERAVQAKMGLKEWRMKEWKMIWKALTTDANIQCLPSTNTLSNGYLYRRIFQGSLFYKFWICEVIHCPRPWFRYVSQRRSLQREFLCVYVIARATTCPNFQCFVCLCGTSLPNCKPIMHFQAFIHA
jgi:hypothetical protein